MDNIKNKNLNLIGIGLSLYMIFIKLIGYIGLFPKINKLIYDLAVIPDWIKDIIIFITYYAIV